MNNSTEYDVVIATLQAKKDSLWRMTQQNMNSEFIGMNIMDQIRLDQIQELNEAMGMWLLWKEEKNKIIDVGPASSKQQQDARNDLLDGTL
jgi:hypothetical protein